MRFLVQKDGMGDLRNALLEAEKWYKWRHGADANIDVHVGYVPPYLSTWCPVGDVQFVIEHEKGTPHIPLNVPGNLFPFYGRRIWHGLCKETIERDFRCGKGELFAKSSTTVKGFSGSSDMWKYMPDDVYDVSEMVEVLSEWRAFIYDGELLDIRRYSGAIDVFPDMGKVRGMVREWGNQRPVACTLDVFVNSHGTFVMEAHDFYACGLYGFNDIERLPLMLWRSFLARHGAK